MPLIGVVCGYDGSYQSFETCIHCHEYRDCKRNCHAPVQVLKSMRDNKKTRAGAGWSISTALSCPRAVALEATYDFYESIDSGWSKARGTWIHAMMEADPDPKPGLIRERRIRRTIWVSGEWVVLSGQPDEVDPDTQSLVDYKSKHLLPKKPDYRHECQFNGYVWLLADGVFADTNEPIKLHIKHGGMHYLTWDKGVIRQFLKREYPVWPLHEIEDFLRTRLEPLVVWKNTQKLPRCQPLIHYGRNWRCDCAKLEEQLIERGVLQEGELNEK